jgi:nitronate monooxygenase
MTTIKALHIGDLVIPIPIIQGGMGVGVSLSGLAAAVANQGGLGVISSAGLGVLQSGKYSHFKENSTKGLFSEILKAKSLSKGVIGVNIMVALTNYKELMETAIAAEADILFSGAGLPFDMPKYLLPASKTKLVPIVSSARAARLICQKWWNNYHYLPDAIVLEGPKAGGHLGFKLNQLNDPLFSLEKLLPEVLDVAHEFGLMHGKKIPVIAAGGIFNGADIGRFLEAGADGVQMGTRFVTTTECDASEDFKQAYLKATKTDIQIIQSPVGMPGRAIKSSFLEDVEAGKRHPKSCPVNCVHTCDIKTAPYCIMAALTAALRGKFNRGYAFAGSNVWRCDKIISVEALMNMLKHEYAIHQLINSPKTIAEHQESLVLNNPIRA